MCERSVLQLEEYVGYDVEARVVEEGGVVVVFREREEDRGKTRRIEERCATCGVGRGGGVWCVVCGVWCSGCDFGYVCVTLLLNCSTACGIGCRFDVSTRQTPCHSETKFQRRVVASKSI
jgi:hypothetical protein